MSRATPDPRAERQHAFEAWLLERMRANRLAEPWTAEGLIPIVRNHAGEYRDRFGGRSLERAAIYQRIRRALNNLAKAGKVRPGVIQVNGAFKRARGWKVRP